MPEPKPIITPPMQDWFPKAPPLPKPKGQVIRVTNPKELLQAAEDVKPGGTILLADGLYQMPKWLTIKTDNVTMRSESGKRERVVLDGSKVKRGELVIVSRCTGVTIADLTIQNVRWNGFKIDSHRNTHNVTIYNCIIHNIWQRGVKGVGVPPKDGVRQYIRNCRIQYCLFYNDRAKRKSDDPEKPYRGFRINYIAGIDVMCAKGWVISDNVFVGIRGKEWGRGAIFMWIDSRDCIIERNIIIDCDAGISLGNPHARDRVPRHATGCIVRNNFVTRGPEAGIKAIHTQDCKILNNTVHEPKSRQKRLLWLIFDNDGLVVKNNLLSGPGGVRNTAKGKIILKNNLSLDATEFFVDPKNGNLHLKKPLPAAVDKAEPLPDVTNDVDGKARGKLPDIGADEL
jgi:parallel beta helix pectate lyase-like protein